jgi:transposase
LCEEYSVLLLFLLLYLLDYNPIEATFKDLKVWVKRNYRLVEAYESFKAFLHLTISQSIGSYTREHYREVEYILD